jgi:uncharacterized membrane protein
MIIFWLLIILAIYYIVNGHENVVLRKDRSLSEDILIKRYINGEFDEETFNKMNNVIK